MNKQDIKAEKNADTNQLVSSVTKTKKVLVTSVMRSTNKIKTN